MSEPYSDVVGTGLSDAERALIDACIRGEVADCKRQEIRGSVLRKLILETEPDWRVADAGVRLRQAIITGGLDLEGCTFAKPIMLWHSRIEGGGNQGTLLMRDARLKRLGLHSCTVEGAIIADRVHIENGLFLGSGVIKGRLQIRGADVGGAIGIDGTEIGDGETAIRAAGLRLQGPLILRRGTLCGAVTLPRAALGAGIYMEDAEVRADDIPTGVPAFDAESARIGGDLLFERARLGNQLRLSNAAVDGRIAGNAMELSGGEIALAADGIRVRQGVELAAAKITGSVVFEGADIGKSFDAEGISIEGGGEAIRADGISIGGNWDLARARLVGQITCPGADIRGQMRLTEARLFGAQLALRADGARIRGGCYFSRAMLFGALRFPAVEIGNQFRLRGATLKVEQGAALFASGASFGRDVELNGGFQSTGAVVFDQASVTGMLDLSQSKLQSAALARDGRPPATAATNVSAAESLIWDETVVSLTDARITRLHLPETEENRPRGVFDLSRAQIGTFLDYAVAWPPPRDERGLSHEDRDIDHLVLDGMTYEHLANPSGGEMMPGMHAHADDRVAKRRIAWLEGQAMCDIAEHFKPQPWVQLGQRLTAQGYHDDARTISIVRRRLELSSHSATTVQRWQGALLDLFALYGHNPWRTIIWMAAFIVLFTGIWAWAASYCTDAGCHDESVFVATSRDGYAQQVDQRFRNAYPAFNSLGYSFDVFVPFVSFGYADHWRPNLNWRPFAEIPVPQGIGRTVVDIEKFLTGSREPSSRTTGTRKNQAIVMTVGGVLYILVVVEMLLGLVLASLAVTGFTGLLRTD